MRFLQCRNRDFQKQINSDCSGFGLDPGSASLHAAGDVGGESNDLNPTLGCVARTGAHS